jgi:hypothetical protein
MSVRDRLLFLPFASGDLDRFTLVLFTSLITFLSQIFYREWLWSNMGGRNSADQFPCYFPHPGNFVNSPLSVRL